MKATIVDLNYARDLYVFECEDGRIGYFELLDGPDLEMDLELLGSFTELGDCFIQCDGNTIKVCIEDYCALNLAQERIR